MKKRRWMKRIGAILLAMVAFCGGFFMDCSLVRAEDIPEDYVLVNVVFYLINIDTGEIMGQYPELTPTGIVITEIKEYNGFGMHIEEQWTRSCEFVYCDTSFPLTVGREDITINQYYKVTYFDTSGMGGEFGSLDELFAAREAYNHTHSYAETITANATCTTNGEKSFSCSCGDTYTETIGALGHSFGVYTYNNDATYDNDGTETASCSRCGVTDTRAAAGTKMERPTEHKHSYTEAITANATCTANGTKTFSCNCGDSYTETIGALGHSFGAYTYNNDATYDKDGTKTAVCSNCGVTDTKTASGTKLVRETENPTTSQVKETEAEVTTTATVESTTEAATQNPSVTGSAATEPVTEEVTSEETTSQAVETEEAVTEEVTTEAVTEESVTEVTTETTTEAQTTKEVSETTEAVTTREEIATQETDVGIDGMASESNTGLIVGIVVAVLVVISIVIAVLVYKKKNK